MVLAVVLWIALAVWFVLEVFVYKNADNPEWPDWRALVSLAFLLSAVALAFPA